MEDSMVPRHVFGLLAASSFLLSCGNGSSDQDRYRAQCGGLHPVGDFCQIPTFTIKPDALNYPLTAEDNTIEITSSRPIAHDYGEYLEARAVQKNLQVALLVFGENESYQNFNVDLFTKGLRPPSAGQLRPGEFTLGIVFHSSDGATTVEAPFSIKLAKMPKEPNPSPARRLGG